MITSGITVVASSTANFHSGNSIGVLIQSMPMPANAGCATLYDLGHGRYRHLKVPSGTSCGA
jgi:hypothetical protein